MTRGRRLCERAVVIGGSVSGLLAARVLASRAPGGEWPLPAGAGLPE